MVAGEASRIVLCKPADFMGPLSVYFFLSPQNVQGKRSLGQSVRIFIIGRVRQVVREFLKFKLEPQKKCHPVERSRPAIHLQKTT
jgi:hypothetical protein